MCVKKKLCLTNQKPHRTSLLIIAVRNFQKFSDRSFVSAFELIFVLKLVRLDCKMLLPKHKKTTIAINISLQSAQQRQYVF